MSEQMAHDPKADAVMVEDVESRDDDRRTVNKGGVDLYKNDAIVLIPTPSPDPKGSPYVFSLQDDRLTSNRPTESPDMAQISHNNDGWSLFGLRGPGHLRPRCRVP
jgi:hypothetical protein